MKAITHLEELKKSYQSLIKETNEQADWHRFKGNVEKMEACYRLSAEWVEKIADVEEALAELQEISKK